MDSELIRKLAKDAGLFTHKEVQPELEAFAKLVAEQAIKYGPCYQVGYADGEFAERERLTKLLQEGGK